MAPRGFGRQGKSDPAVQRLIGTPVPQERWNKIRRMDVYFFQWRAWAALQLGVHWDKTIGRRGPFQPGHHSGNLCDGELREFGSKSLVDKITKAFKEHSEFPAETIVAPTMVPGIDWSDHGSFWKYGYKAIMVTDTSFYRYQHYHAQSDTYEKLDYESMAEVVYGLHKAIEEL